MSFRSRLLLAIVGVVVFTTTASLIVAQRQHGAAYRTLANELLSNQAQWFRRLQGARQEQAAETAARLAGSVRLFAALEAQDPAVYQIAGDELRLGEFSFFRLLDASGRLIEPPQDHGGEAPPLPDWLVAAGRLRTRGDDGVELGYLLGPVSETVPGRLYRIMAAPIRSFDRLVGTLLLGQRVAAMEEPAAAGGTLAITHSSLWLEGRLAADGLPPNVRAPLLAAIGREDAAGGNQIRAGDSRYFYQLTPLNAGSAWPTAYLVSLFSLDGFVAERNELRWRIVLTGAAAALLAVLLSVALSRQLANPIRNLVRGTERISQGDFGHRLGASSTLEFDRLAGAFNEMAAELALKERYRSVLNQIADAEVADALVAGRIELGGERRDVTVMFCDIRDYTLLTRQSSPEAMIELLNRHYGELARVVREHRGVINQFVGDAIMALFGAPKCYGDDAERAVVCALQMIEARERLNQQTAVPVQVGIGIASGPVVTGCIGDERRSDYTAVGEHVNLAARLSGAAAAGEILIDEGTRRRLDATVSAEPTPPMQLKGIGSDVRVYRVGRRTAA